MLAGDERCTSCYLLETLGDRYHYSCFPEGHWGPEWLTGLPMDPQRDLDLNPGSKRPEPVGIGVIVNLCV